MKNTDLHRKVMRVERNKVIHIAHTDKGTNKRTYTNHHALYDDGSQGGYVEVTSENTDVTDLRTKHHSKGQTGISAMASGIIGIFGGGFSILFAIYLFVILARSYYGMGFIGIGTFLSALGTHTNSWAHNGANFITNGIGQIIEFMQNTFSIADKLPSDWKGLGDILDILFNIPYQFQIILQGVLMVLRFFSTVLQFVVSIGRFVVDLYTPNSALGSLTDPLINVRNEVWQNLIV